MKTLVINCRALMLTLVWAHLAGFSSANASEPVHLKISKDLSSVAKQVANRVKVQKDHHGLLGKIPLFRGVTVNGESLHFAKTSESKANLEDSKDERRGVMNAIYGGLQISLQENLSLVYAPGRLSGNVMNSESQGLYLLANRGGPANWFMGIESRSYFDSSDSRRTANSAQVGVIVDLD